MAQSATASERVVVLMTPEEKAAVVERARSSGISVAGFIRQAVERFDPAVEAELAEIEPLIATLEESNEEAWRALNRAEAALDQALDQLARSRSGHAAG
ncbi:MAG: hypothetical protein KDE35_15905 [Geminicoccaceae bacterium]|nr:hypothetical protein [Geminicoccaceae bacterium]